MFQLRRWQQEALERCKEMPRSIVEACPGSGKSAFSGGMAKYWLDTGVVSHVLAVVPSTSIQRGVMRSWSEAWGLKVRSRLVRKTGNAFKVPVRHDATVITYQELRNDQCEDALRLWISSGWKFGVVFDEIHHAAKDKSWGERVGVIGHDLASRVCIMTGTPFRSDSQPIQLMEYVLQDDQHVASPSYRYTYRDAVQEHVCRPVACRWIDGEVTLSHQTRRIETKQISELSEWELGTAISLFFDPNGEPMKNMVSLVHSELMRLRSDPRYHDAGALFVCRPGRNKDVSADKHVREMAKLIERITGNEVVVVTHDDKDSADKIDAFNRSTAPYIAAVNMVSEGVDIPRLRKVAFCRHTDSEMLFRQIVGRVVRMTIENDPSGAEIYVPSFAAMRQYGQRLWDEADAGLKERRPSDIGRKCHTCGRELCICEGSQRYSKNLVGIDASGGAGGGHFDSTEVEHEWIAAAEDAIKQHSSFSCFSTTHFAAYLKSFAKALNHSPIVASESQHLDNLCDRLRRRVNRLAHIAYSGNFGETWVVEVFEKYNVESLEDIKTLWTHDRIESAIKHLEFQIDAYAHNREVVQ